MDRLGLRSELVQGDRGIFDVAVDGKLIFSKYKEGRFPENSEIIDMLRSRKG